MEVGHPILLVETRNDNAARGAGVDHLVLADINADMVDASAAFVVGEENEVAGLDFLS